MKVELISPLEERRESQNSVQMSIPHRRNSVDHMSQLIGSAPPAFAEEQEDIVFSPIDIADVKSAQTPPLWAKVLGHSLTFLFSFGCATSTIACLFPFITSMPIILLTAALSFFAFYANYSMGHIVVTNFFAKLGSLFKDESGNNLNLKRSLLLVLGIVLGLAFGFSVGAFACNAVLTAAAFAKFAAISPFLLPAAGAMIGAATFGVLSAIMVNAFSALAKAENLPQKVLNKFKYIFSYQPKGRDKNKSFLRFVAERAAIGLLFAAASGVFAAIMMGQVFFMNACAFGMNNLLAYIPGANLSAINIASTIITMGLALPGQLHFLANNALAPVVDMFVPMEESGAVVPLTTKIKLAIIAFFNAGSNAGIAFAPPAHINATTGIAALGNFANSFSAVFVTALSGEAIQIAQTATAEKQENLAAGKLNVKQQYFADRRVGLAPKKEYMKVTSAGMFAKRAANVAAGINAAVTQSVRTAKI